MRTYLVLSAALLLCGCGGAASPGQSGGTPSPTPTVSPTPTPTAPVTGVSQSAAIGVFDQPWAIDVLPDGRFLVTQRNATGALSLITAAGTITPVSNLPVTIGLLDIQLSSDFSSSRRIYFSSMVRDLAAPRVGRAAADASLFPERMVVFSATLVEGAGTASLTNVSEIFRQVPTIVTFPGSGEPGGRITIAPDGMLLITSGDRQELDSAFLFAMDNTIGKIVRIRTDGTVPSDNPFVGIAGARPEIWTLGHRNPYGLAFAPNGQLWSSEHGPKGGDEFNLITRGSNYGWPMVSNGDNYVGPTIPDHAPGDGFAAPAVSWTPVIAPGGMLFYTGNRSADWRGDAILAGLSSKALVRVRISGTTAAEVQRIDIGTRVRDLVQTPDGSLYILTDGSAGELRRIDPVF
jgi:glucose/arabinose dehydrogenase